MSRKKQMVLAWVMAMAMLLSSSHMVLAEAPVLPDGTNSSIPSLEESSTQAQSTSETDAADDDKALWLPLRQLVEKQGYAYVRTRAANVKVYQRDNLLKTLGVLPEKETLLLVIGYSAKEGDKLDTAHVCFSDGEKLVDGYVPVQRLAQTIEDEALLLTAAQPVEGEAVQPALKDSPFLWEEKPVAVVKYEVSPTEAEQAGDAPLTNEETNAAATDAASEAGSQQESAPVGAPQAATPAQTQPVNEETNAAATDAPSETASQQESAPVGESQVAAPAQAQPVNEATNAAATDAASETASQQESASVETPEAEQAVASAAVAATTVKSKINFRPQPNKDSGRIFLIATAGTQVEVLSKTVDAEGQLWYQVRYKDEVGYILGELLALPENAEIPEQKPLETEQVTENVEAATQSEPQADPTEQEEAGQTTPVGDAAEIQPSEPKQGILCPTTAAKVIFRDSPSTDGNRLVRIENADTDVEVLASVTGSDGAVWYQARYQGQVGYVLGDLLLVPENVSIPSLGEGIEESHAANASQAAPAGELPPVMVEIPEAETEMVASDKTGTITAFFSEDWGANKSMGAIPMPEGEQPDFPKTLYVHLMETDEWTEIPVSRWTDEDGDGKYTPVWNQEQFPLGVDDEWVPYCTVVTVSAAAAAPTVSFSQGLESYTAVATSDANGYVSIGGVLVNLNQAYYTKDDTQEFNGAGDEYLYALVHGVWPFRPGQGNLVKLSVTPHTGTIYGWKEPILSYYDCTDNITTDGNELNFSWNYQAKMKLDGYRFVNRVPVSITLPVPIRTEKTVAYPDEWSHAPQVTPAGKDVTITNTRYTIGDLRSRFDGQFKHYEMWSVSNKEFGKYISFQITIEHATQINESDHSFVSNSSAENISWDFGADMDLYYTIDIAPITVGGDPYLCPDSLPDSLETGSTIQEALNNNPKHYFGTTPINNGTEQSKPLGTIPSINENDKDSGKFTGDRKYGQYGDETCFNCNPWDGYTVDKVYIYVYDPLTEELLPGYPKAYDSCKEANEAYPNLLGKTEIRVAYRVDIPVEKVWADGNGTHDKGVTFRFERRLATHDSDGVVRPVEGAEWETMDKTITLNSPNYEGIYSIALEEKEIQVYQYRLIEDTVVDDYITTYLPIDGIYVNAKQAVINIPQKPAKVTKVWQGKDPDDVVKDIREHLVLGVIEKGTFRALNDGDLSWLGVKELPTIEWDGDCTFTVNGLPQYKATRNEQGQVLLTPIEYAFQETSPAYGYMDPTYSSGTYASNEGTITNPYATLPVILGASKLLDGKASDVIFDFTATVQPVMVNGEDVTADRVTPASVTGSNNNAGQVTFGAFTIKEPGTYIFNIQEDLEKLPAGYIGDSNVYRACVVVSRNTTTGRMELSSVTYSTTTPDKWASNQPSFHNIKLPIIELSAKKIFTGGTIADHQFSFTATQTGETDEAGNSVEFSKEPLEAYCKADGTIVFEPISVSHLGVYTYKVEEIKGNDGTILYSGAVYTVQATVTEDAQTGESAVSYTYFVENANVGKVEVIPTGNSASPLPFENTKMTQLRLEKTVEDGGIGGQVDVNFLFTVLVNGEPYSGEYMSSINGRGGSTTNGIIPLLGSEIVTLPHLAAGAAYAVTEQQVDGYTASYPTATEGILAPEDNLVTIVNTPMRGKLTLYKYGADALNLPLAGAQYVLYTESSTGRLYYSAVGGVVRWISSENGATKLTTTTDGVTVTNLPLGTFYLVEVTPPDGYYIDGKPTPVKITVTPAASSQRQDGQVLAEVVSRVLGIGTACAEGSTKSFVVVDGQGSQVDKPILTPSPTPYPWGWDETSDQTNQEFYAIGFLISVLAMVALTAALLVAASRRRKGR